MAPALDRKIVDPQRLAAVVAEARTAGRTVVHCHGCFDIVHPGHVRYLRFARELGDVLIVSLTSDRGVGKGPDRPYIPQELRAENLAALEFVDWVVICPDPTAAELLELLRPDVYVKGREYAEADDPRFVRERQTVERYGGRVVFHSGDVVFSSTRLIRSLERNAHLDEVRLRTVCGRSGIDAAAARAAIEHFAGLPVIVVGDVIREEYVLCDATEAADDAPILALQQLGTTAAWGGAAAVALQLRALGAAPVLVTATSIHERDAGALSELADQGVTLHALPIRREPLVQRTFIADDTKLLRLSSGAGQPPDSTWQRQAEAAIRQALRHAALLAWCDYGYGMVSPGLVQAIRPAARQRGLLVAGGTPSARGDIKRLTGTDLLCVSERRLRESLHDMGQSLPALVWQLLQDARGWRALVPLHKRGLLGFEGSGAALAAPEPAGASSPKVGPAEAPLAPTRLRSEFVPSLAQHYADLLGAAEAILATAALTLATGGSLALATYLAAAAESLAVTRPGRVSVTAAELRAWIDTRPELRAQSRFLPDAAAPADLARIAPPLGAEVVDAHG